MVIPYSLHVRDAMPLSLIACRTAAAFSEIYHVSPISKVGHCFYVMTMCTISSLRRNKECMLSVELKWYTNEQVQSPEGRNEISGI